MAQEKQSLASMEQDYRNGPPWLMVVFVAMLALLAMFFILNAEMVNIRGAHSGGADPDQQSALEREPVLSMSSIQ